MKRLRILLADDHTLFRQHVRRILQEKPELEVVAEAKDGREAVLRAVDLKPDVAILDITKPHLDGTEATQQIAWRAPEVQVLVLSVQMDESHILQVLRAGARGYLFEDSVDEDLLRAVIAVSEGKFFLSPGVAKVMLDSYVHHLEKRRITDRFDLLSKREREVFELIVKGYSNKEIAQVLGLRPSTSKTHRVKLMEKLDLHSTTEVILYAVRKGFLPECPKSRIT